MIQSGLQSMRCRPVAGVHWGTTFSIEQDLRLIHPNFVFLIHACSFLCLPPFPGEATLQLLRTSPKDRLITMLLEDHYIVNSKRGEKE
jgi:hypothetical protein